MYLTCAPSQLPADDRLALMAAAWDEALTAVSTKWLERVFAVAVSAHRTPYPLTTGDILTAWDDMLDERRRAVAAQAASPAPALPAGDTSPCPTCAGKGLVIDASSPVSHRVLLKCPMCRGAGTRSAPRGTPAPTYYVTELLSLLADWCREIGDPVNGLTRLRAALALVAAGITATNARALLADTGAPTLVGAMAAHGIAVPPVSPAEATLAGKSGMVP